MMQDRAKERQQRLSELREKYAKSSSAVHNEEIVSAQPESPAVPMMVQPDGIGELRDEAPEVQRQETSSRRFQRLPIWDRKMRILEETGNTPRDFLENDAFYFEAPKATRDNCCFMWMSNILAERRPILTGFSYDIWSPCTPDEMKELGVKVRTKDRTPAGVPKVGSDAFLVWAPRQAVNQIKEFWDRGSRTAEMMQSRAQQYRESVPPDDTGHSGPIGDVFVSNDMREIHEAETRQRGEMGRALGGSVGG